MSVLSLDDLPSYSACDLALFPVSPCPSTLWICLPAYAYLLCFWLWLLFGTLSWYCSLCLWVINYVCGLDIFRKCNNSGLIWIKCIYKRIQKHMLFPPAASTSVIVVAAIEIETVQHIWKEKKKTITWQIFKALRIIHVAGYDTHVILITGDTRRPCFMRSS